jgi:hypothetical protein
LQRVFKIAKVIRKIPNELETQKRNASGIHVVHLHVIGLYSSSIFPDVLPSSNIGTVRPPFLRVRKGAEGALINIHTNEGA